MIERCEDLGGILVYKDPHMKTNNILIGKIQKAANYIVNKSRTPIANYIIVSSEIANMINDLYNEEYDINDRRYKILKEILDELKNNEKYEI